MIHSHSPIILKSSMAQNSNGNALEVIHGLVESWCDRRCLRALRAVLQGYPLVSLLGDGRGELRLALENVRAFAREEITAEELQAVNNIIRQLETN